MPATKLRRWLATAVFAVVGTLAVSARADDVDDKLNTYESEARDLGANLPRPNQVSPAQGGRKLVDAEVSYALGDYDTAALALFDLAQKPGSDQETANFYLGEALFQKGDKGAARGYYEQVISTNNVASKYYQPALVRLVEIAIVQGDDSNVGQHLAALDRIAAGLRLPSVPYVRGKYAYSQGKLDEALAFFNDVPKGSDYEMQAAYYTATVYVTKANQKPTPTLGETGAPPPAATPPANSDQAAATMPPDKARNIQKATDIFTDLVNRKPRTNNDRRIIELSQLGLGRLYYEADQMSKSIDSYLLVDRHSDLFPDALYEVAWVYVKSKQFDKALRALELLSLSDPTSTKTPTVRILEGNLRIRKAQMIRQRQINGVIDNRDADDPATEYDKAAQVFSETHDMYMPSYVALSQMVDANADASQYLQQIAGRSAHVFQAVAPLPEAAAQYLRDEPEVQRLVAVEDDLGEINANLNEAESTIARLEGVMASADHSTVYPALASRRARIGQIQDDLNKLRIDLADQQLRLIDSSGDLAGLSATRKQLAQQYAASGNAEQVAVNHLAQNQEGYDKIEDTAGEVDTAIDSTQAMAVALRKFANDTPDMPADQKKQIAETLDAAAKEADAIETEIDGVHRELQIGRDLAGVGDEAVTAARQLRKQLDAALDAEHKVLAGFASASRDKAKSQKLAALGDRAARISESLEATEKQIDQIVEQGLADVKGQIAQEQKTIAQYKAELAEYEAESKNIGGTVLGTSFKNVKLKFYDVVIRTDVGNVDVAWSQKEDNDDDLKRLNLSRQRELKQLKDEFKDILDAGTEKPSAPKKPELGDLPPPVTNTPSGSPDKGGPDKRVSPGGTTPTTPAAPTVKPDDAKKGTPKGTTPKPPHGTGGNK